MTQNKKLNFKIGLLAILTLLVFGIGCVLAYTTNAQKVYADYEDLSGDTIVNFNQLLLFSTGSATVSGITRTTTEYTYSISGTATADGRIWAGVSGLTTNHIYYIKTPDSEDYTKYYYPSSSIVSSSDEDYLFTFTRDSDFTYAIYFYSGTTYDVTFNPYLIDLTLMYGSGFEPSLAECKEIFTADYYSYTAGTAIAYSSFGAYNAGYNAAVSAQEINYSTTSLLYSAYNITSSTFESPSSYQDYDNLVKFDGVIAFPLGLSLVEGDTVTISCNFVVIVGSADLYFGYYQNGTFIQLAYLDHSTFSDGEVYIYQWDSTVTFTCPSSIDTLYITPSVVGTGVYIDSITVSAVTYNATAALSVSYDSGYERGYLAGIAKGETIGYSEGLEAAENATFQSLFSAIIDAPVNVIASALDFDLLGINLKTFFFSLFTVALVITIVRLFI